MRTDSRCRKLRHIAPGAASYGTACGWEHLAAALWLPTAGDREHWSLGQLRQPPILKAWHIHGNPLHRGATFSPNLADVGKPAKGLLSGR